MFEAAKSAGRVVGRHLFAYGLILLAIAGWWLISLTLSPRIFPPLGQVAQTLYQLALSPEFWLNVCITFGRIVLAILLATIIGGVIGLMPRYLPVTSGIVDGVLIPLFSSFPSLAWAILGTVWFGVTATAVVVVQLLIVLPFVLVNVAEGAKAIGTDEVEMGRSFSRSRGAVFWRIELPLLSPFLLSAVTISYGVCWKISLIAELFGARSGVGFMMQSAQDLGQVDRIVSLSLAVVFFVVVGQKLILQPLSALLLRGENSSARRGGASSTIAVTRWARWSA